MFFFNKIQMKYSILLISIMALFLMGCAGNGVQSVPTGNWGISSQNNEHLKSLPVLTRDADFTKEKGRVNRIDAAKRGRFILAKRKKMPGLKRPINIEDIEAKIQEALDSGDITKEQAEEKRTAVEKKSAILDKKKGGRKPMEHMNKGGRKPMEHMNKGGRKPMEHMNKGGRKPMEHMNKGERKPMEHMNKGEWKPLEKAKSRRK